MQNRILQRIEELKGSSPRDIIEISVNYKDKKVYKYEIEINDFEKEVLENDNTSLFYFFKDVTNDLEELLIKKHRDMMFEEMEKNNND